MKLSKNQMEAIKKMQQHPDRLIMHDGWMTGGHGIKINLNTLRSLERLDLVYKGKLTDLGKNIS